MEEPPKLSEFYGYIVKDAEGKDVPLITYQGKVCVVVNVASKCGLTPRDYPQLQELYSKYNKDGLEVLGFPCNQFLSQEPGDMCQITEFTKSKGVEFPIFEKIEVNGENTHPLFAYLKVAAPGSIANFIKWNFTKFLVDRNGVPVRRYGPNTQAADMEEDIKKLLKN